MMMKPWRVVLLRGYSHQALCSDGSTGQGHHGHPLSILSAPDDHDDDEYYSDDEDDDDDDEYNGDDVTFT